MNCNSRVTIVWSDGFKRTKERMCMVHLVCDAGKNDIIDNVLKSLFLTLLIVMQNCLLAWKIILFRYFSKTLPTKTANFTL